MININIDTMNIDNCNINMSCQSLGDDNEGVIPNNSFYMFLNSSFPMVVAAKSEFSTEILLESPELSKELQLWTFFFLGGTTYTLLNNGSNSSRFLATMDNMPSSEVIVAENTDNPNSRWQPDIVLDLGLLYIVRLFNVSNQEYFYVDTSGTTPKFTTAKNIQEASVFTLVGLPFIESMGLGLATSK